MQFRTYINIKPYSEQIDLSKSIFSLGSCFAENIASKLQRAKFCVTASPTGILFNPESIADTITRLASTHCDESLNMAIREGLHSCDGRWFSYDVHSSLCDNDADTTVAKIAAAYRQGHEVLRQSNVVILTFGTAWVYRLRETGEVVANCHKQPHNLFSRELLSVEHIVNRYSELLSNAALADKRVIFTVSPVRHLADGLADNSLSKAILRVAIGELVRTHSNAEYFPAYEILNDELRDYRFYAEDMIHPSPTAINYIWQRFGEYAFSDSTRQLIEQAESITQASEHRPMNPASQAHKTFCKQMLDRIAKIKERHPNLDFSKETDSFCKYL
ncbi:MAG: GSCFA domain-containing protein [Alistipes sp.]|nr:GSCFA domain-containing protein [Alistipes sp.]